MNRLMLGLMMSLLLASVSGCKSPPPDTAHLETARLKGYRMLVLYDLPDDPAAFLAHYETVHVPLARKVKGLRVFEYGRVDNAPLPVPIGSNSPTWFAAQVVFDDAAAFGTAMSTPEAAAALADVPNLTTPDKVHFLVGEVRGEFPDLKTPPQF